MTTRHKIQAPTMKPSTSITTRERITTNRTTRVLMQSLTWTTITIKPTAIITPRTIIIVRVNVCIALIISHRLWLSIGDTFAWSCYLLVALLLCCYYCYLVIGVGFDYCWWWVMRLIIYWGIVKIIVIVVVIRNDDIILLPQSDILLCNQHSILLLILMIVCYNDDIILILCVFYNNYILSINFCYTVLMIYRWKSPYLIHWYVNLWWWVRRVFYKRLVQCARVCLVWIYGWIFGHSIILFVSIMNKRSKEQ